MTRISHRRIKLKHVGTEMALHVLAYNINRVNNTKAAKPTL